MSEQQLDEQLVARAQAGDNRAFDLLVRKYQSRIIQLCNRLVGDADSMDVAQEAFIKAFRALKGFRGQSAFYTWLYRIAINTSKNHLVARKRRPSYQDIDVQDAELYGHTEQLSGVDTPEAELLSDEIRQKADETEEDTGSGDTEVSYDGADSHASLVRSHVSPASYWIPTHPASHAASPRRRPSAGGCIARRRCRSVPCRRGRRCIPTCLPRHRHRSRRRRRRRRRRTPTCMASDRTRHRCTWLLHRRCRRRRSRSRR